MVSRRSVFQDVYYHWKHYEAQDDAPSIWKMLIASVKSLGHTVRRIRIDNDTVFLSKEFTTLCVSKVITVERTVPYAHSQLGKKERQWRTLADGAKTLLLMVDLPNRF